MRIEDHDDVDKDPDFNLYSDSDDRNSDEFNNDNEIDFAPSNFWNLNSSLPVKRRKLNTNVGNLGIVEDQNSKITPVISISNSSSQYNSVLIRPTNPIDIPTWSTENYNILPDKRLMIFNQVCVMI